MPLSNFLMISFNLLCSYLRGNHHIAAGITYSKDFFFWNCLLSTFSIVFFYHKYDFLTLTDICKITEQYHWKKGEFNDVNREHKLERRKMIRHSEPILWTFYALTVRCSSTYMKCLNESSKFPLKYYSNNENSFQTSENVHWMLWSKLTFTCSSICDSFNSPISALR